MDPVVKEMWTEALRSGKYEQGHNRLRSNESYCCLGVLCDLYDSRGWLIRTEYADEEYPFPHTYLTYKGATAIPPEEVLEWANLTTKELIEIPDHPGELITATSVLMRKNDWENYTFEDMANLIDKEL